MLTSLVLAFRPPTPTILPRDLGRASHALMLRLIASLDPDLAQAMHAGDGPRPFACSNVYGGRRNGSLLLGDLKDLLWIRCTGLTAQVSGMLQRIAASPPADVELDRHPMRLEYATLDPAVHPRAGSQTYEALAAPYLLARDAAPWRLHLRFISPTAFRSRGLTVPLPLPGSVFGSLVDRWNAFAPIHLAPEARRFADECMALSQFRGRTRVYSGKDESQHSGFVGAATFAATNRDRYWVGIMNVLADFARYSGVGLQTTQGMGQVRRLTDDEMQALRSRRREAGGAKHAEMKADSVDAGS